nr:unnamed protein product [Digitaria exilis]
MDTMLKAERDEIDRMIERERVRMDAEKMQLRVEMGRKLHQDSNNVDSKVPLEEQSVGMKFRVHVGGTFSINPNRYVGGRTICMAFAKIEWDLMVEKLSNHGYNGIADLYYLDPAREALDIDGLVLMEGPEQVHQLLQDHEGRHICDLYIVKYSAISSDDYDESDSDDGSYKYDGSAEKEDDVHNLFDIEELKAFIPADPALVTTKKGHMHENQLKSGGSTVVSSEKGALQTKHRFMGSQDFDKEGPLQPKRQQTIEHDGNPVTGGGRDGD